jgi:hypothetical protein
MSLRQVSLGVAQKTRMLFGRGRLPNDDDDEDTVPNAKCRLPWPEPPASLALRRRLTADDNQRRFGPGSASIVVGMMLALPLIFITMIWDGPFSAADWAAKQQMLAAGSASAPTPPEAPVASAEAPTSAPSHSTTAGIDIMSLPVERGVTSTRYPAMWRRRNQPATP